MAGQRGAVEIDKKTTIDVKCKVINLSFSAHADAKGIMQLIRHSEPKNVMLVHGEKGKMFFLKQKIIQKFQIPCFDPPNGTTVVIKTNYSLPIDLSLELIRVKAEKRSYPMNITKEGPTIPVTKRIRASEKNPIHGVLVMKQKQESVSLSLLHPFEAIDDLGLAEHKLKFTSSTIIPTEVLDPTSNSLSLLNKLYSALSEWLEEPVALSRDVRSILIRSVLLTIKDNNLVASWSYQDEEIATHTLSTCKKILENFKTLDVSKC